MNMNCKITRNAAKILKRKLETKHDMMIRVFISHSHGDHAHYDLELDKPTEKDEVVMTDKEISVILSKEEPLLDGVK
jgi:Fe-S cluster assembly iron-binding protein IscA